MQKVTNLFISIKIIFILQFILFYHPNPVRCGSWFPIHENAAFGKIYGVIAENTNFANFYGVGAAGKFYSSQDFAYSWQMQETIVKTDLYSISSGYDFTAGQLVLLAAGQSGVVLRSKGAAISWNKVNSLLQVNYNCVHYNSVESTFWLGGENGILYYSKDFGTSWVRVLLGDNKLNIKQIFGSLNSLFLIAVKNDSSFILRKDVVLPNFFSEKGDTLANIELVNNALPNLEFASKIYFVGKNIQDGTTSVWTRGFWIDQNIPLQQVFSGNLGAPVDIALAVDYPENILWITTLEGNVWESRDNGQNWSLSYEDQSGRALGPIVVNDNALYDYGRIIGDGGLVLKYGFELVHFSPAMNQHVSNLLDKIELKFSGIPDLDSIQSGTAIRSSISGYRPFTAEYDNADSTHVFLYLDTSIQPWINIPGDQWNISLASKIQAANIFDANLFNGFNYDISFLPPQQSDFKFKLLKQETAIQKSTTNYITGFFNDDDTFDLITFAGDALYCYPNLNMLSSEAPLKIYLGPIVTVNHAIPDQLLAADIDRNGKQDLILYDQSDIFILLNKSTSSDFNFVSSWLRRHTSNIRQVATYNADDNEFVDLLVLNDSLYTIFDLSEKSFGKSRLMIEEPPHNYQRITAGDINRDGRQDLTLIDNQGGLIFREGGGSGYFIGQSASGESGYTAVKMTDLDENGLLETLALKPDRIDIYSVNIVNGWDFYTYGIHHAAVARGQTFRDFIVHDLGGDRMEGTRSIMDLAVITGDSLKFFENITQNEHQYLFSELSNAQQKLTLNGNGIIYGDFDKDAFLDVVAFDNQTGQSEIWRKSRWQPVMQASGISRRAVKLQWTPLPADIGSLMYYRVLRDTLPQFSSSSFYREVNSPSLTDSMVNPYGSYWYWVQAIYNAGIPSEWSAPLPVNVFIELNGIVSGALTDITRVYLATGSLTVPPDASLSIHGGAELAFKPGLGLDVQGGLKVRGSSEERMVHFYPMDYKEANWKGITLQASGDTALFEWFSISGAQNGVLANNRPLFMHFGGLNFNQQAINFSGESLRLQNVILDSNYIGLNIGDQSQAVIKNVNILHSQSNSVLASGSANVLISNAIIWNNGFPVLRKDESASVNVRYSTVDSLGAGIDRLAITSLPPLFMPADSGYYRDAYFSPTIDAGDPADDFSAEPQPNGGRINQGLLGGTWLATPSLQPRIALNPTKILTKATRVESDTTNLFIKNYGFAPLRVTEIALLGNTDAFKVASAAPYDINAGDSLQLQLIFQPPMRGEYRDTILIKNNDPHLPYGIKTLPLLGRGLNSNPQLTGDPPRLAFTGQLYHHKILAMDLDGDSLSYSAIQLPNWLTLADSGLISGMPALSDTGVSHVKIIISELYEGFVLLEYDIAVKTGGLGTPPVVTVNPLEEGVLTQSAVRFKFWVTDPPGLPTGSGEVYRIRYFLLDRASEILPMIIDTTGINEVIFYPLRDGQYRFKIWAYDRFGNGLKGEGAVSVDFKVAAAVRAAVPQRWQMIAFPRSLPVNWRSFGHSDSSAVLYNWDNRSEQYITLSREKIEPGQAFWMMPLKPLIINLNQLASTQDDELLPARHLDKGWNQIGIPLSYNLRWFDMYFTADSSPETLSVASAIQDTLIDGAVYWFDMKKDIQGYDWTEPDSNTLARPWLGYWIKCNTPGMLHFSKKPAFEPSQPGIAGKKPSLLRTGDDWQINISLRNEKYADLKNVLGVSRQPRNAVYEPPHFGDYCALYFLAGKNRLTQKFESNFSRPDEVKSWDVRVESAVAQAQHSLVWDSQQISASGVYLFLIDEQNEKMINMAEEDHYDFQPSKNSRSFKIYASIDAAYRPEIVPLQFKLDQNYPNPFNPTTTIRIGLPQNASGQRTILKIYDVLGKEVITLFDGTLDSGYHEFEWNSLNQYGNLVASGIYFYQLINGKTHLMKKMVLLR